MTTEPGGFAGAVIQGGSDMADITLPDVQNLVARWWFNYDAADFDVPKDTYTVWARAGSEAIPGICWWDDLKFEVLGDTPANGPMVKGPSPIMKKQSN